MPRDAEAEPGVVYVDSDGDGAVEGVLHDPHTEEHREPPRQMLPGCGDEPPETIDAVHVGTDRAPVVAKPDDQHLQASPAQLR